jgi:transglutaminase-like putative cysteine protease
VREKRRYSYRSVLFFTDVIKPKALPVGIKGSPTFKVTKCPRISRPLCRWFFTVIVCLQVLCVYHAQGHLAYGEVVYVQGEMNSSATVYITKRITSYTGTKNLTYLLYYPTSYSSGLYTQKITGLYKTFTPYPTDLEEFIDEYGNSAARLSWNREIRIVQFDLRFNVEVYTNFYPVLSSAPFPVILDESQALFLGSTSLAPSDDFIINYIGRTLSEDLYREVDVVNSVFLWIDRNINLSKNTEVSSDHSALDVLKSREGGEQGVCNLACALLKGLGIPARVSYGISFQKEIPIKTPDENILFDLPNKERYWVEAYFPDLGWASYDPHGMYLGLLSHVVKLSHGPDSALASEVWSVEKGDINLFKEFIFDIKSDMVSIEFDSYGDEPLGKLVVSPPVPDRVFYSEEPDLDLEPLKVEESAAPAEEGFSLDNSDIYRKLDLPATRNRVYAQRFVVNRPVTLREVRLPLIKFSDEGRIWVEVFTDLDGRPHKKLIQTYSINSSVVRHMMEENPWLTFPIGKKTPSELEPGPYWIALRSSGNCIFNWHASEGNIVGDSRDTRFMDVSLKKPHWNNVLNYDMNFQLSGTERE